MSPIIDRSTNLSQPKWYFDSPKGQKAVEFFVHQVLIVRKHEHILAATHVKERCEQKPESIFVVVVVVVVVVFDEKMLIEWMSSRGGRQEYPFIHSP